MSVPLPESPDVAGAALSAEAHEWTTRPRTPLGRLVPAIMASQIGFYIALLTPIQLLLTLRLTAIAGAAAFYVARIILQRTSLRPERRPRSARLPEPRREPR